MKTLLLILLIVILTEIPNIAMSLSTRKRGMSICWIILSVAAVLLSVAIIRMGI